MLIHVLTTNFSWRELPPFFTVDAESPVSLVDVLMPLLNRSPLIAMLESLPSPLGLVLVVALAAITIHRIWAIPSARCFVPFGCFVLLCLPIPQLITVFVTTGWMLAVWLPYTPAPVAAPKPAAVLWRAPAPVER